VIGEPPLFDVIFTDQPIKDYRDTLKGDKAMAAALQPAFARPRHHEGRGKYYVSLAHTRADIDQTIGA